MGTYYFKHEETTDSEAQLSNNSNLRPHTPMAESSEDEWTYTANDKMNMEKKGDVSEQKTILSISRSSCQDIRKLVQHAEELVRESPAKRNKSSVGITINKMTRVKQWLNMDQPTDSCDASCEEEDKESQSSEDLNESVATCRAQQDSLCQSVILDADKIDSTPKVTLRQKRIDLKRNRPWSISCLSQLPYGLARYVNGIEFSFLDFTFAH